MYEDIIKRLRAGLRMFIEMGMVQPFYIAAVGAGGAMLYLVMKQKKDASGVDCEFLCEHIPEGRLRFPINLMWVASRGEAARMVLGPDDPSPTVVH